MTKNDQPQPSPKRRRGRPPAEKPPGADKEQVLFVRAPQALIARIDAHLARLKQKHPTFRLHRSDVVRTLVERAIAIEESETLRESSPPSQGDSFSSTDIDLGVSERHVLEAIQAVEKDGRAALVEVFAQCRGIPRRDYEESLRMLERAGVVSFEWTTDASALSERERTSSVIEQRGTIAAVSLVRNTADRADTRREGAS